VTANLAEVERARGLRVENWLQAPDQAGTAIRFEPLDLCAMKGFEAALADSKVLPLHALSEGRRLQRGLPFEVPSGTYRPWTRSKPRG
jgi:hypothetical protein